MYADIADIESFMGEMVASLKKSRAENAGPWGDNCDSDDEQVIANMKAWWRERIAYLNVEINRTEKGSIVWK